QDSPLLCAIPKLHKAAAIEPPRGNAALLGRAYDRCRTWPEADLLKQPRQLFDRTCNIKRMIVHRRQAKVASQLQRTSPDLLFNIFHGHPIDPVLGSLTRPPKADFASGQRLKLKRHVLHDMRLISTATQS